MNPQQAPDTKNFLLAIGLIMALFVVWDMFVMSPQAAKEKARQAAIKKQEQLAAPQGLNPALPANVQTGLPRAQALAISGQRIVFDTPSIDGSISVKGGKIDDLKLKAYRETLDKASPEITLLTPRAANLSYFAEFGWTSAAGASPNLPGPDTPWQVSGANRLSPGSPVTLTWENGQGLRFTRVIAVDAHFMFTIADTVENTGGQTASIFPYAMIQRHGLPKDHVANWILHEGGVGTLNNTARQKTYAEMEEKLEYKESSPGGWLGITDKYWMTALIPPQNETIQSRFAALPGKTANANQSFTQYQADYLLPVRQIAPGAKASVEHKFFAGAKIRKQIAAYQDTFNIPRFENAIDWGWFWFFTWPIFLMLEWLYALLGNFGVAILALTVVIKAIFFPLANLSYAAMSKLKKVQPELQQMQENYKDDRVKLQQEMMALYRREKINPLMGCLPILIQIPVFFSLYKVLFVTIEMRHAPFFGWVQDLAAPDPTSIFNLFGLLPYAVPAALLLGVWPILMGITMWIQTKMNPPAQDPMQQSVLNWMPWIFMFMMATFPAGLMIYWVWNNVLSIAQQYFIMRKHGTPIEIVDNLKLPSWLTRTAGGDPPKPKA